MSATGRDLDMQIRLAAFEHLAELARIHGDVLPAGALRDGFDFEGQRVRLKGVQGIFKPAVLPELPLSILADVLPDAGDICLDRSGIQRGTVEGWPKEEA